MLVKDQTNMFILRVRIRYYFYQRSKIHTSLVNCLTVAGS